jgi:hypothetical protein
MALVRKIFAVVGVVVLLASLFGWWLFAMSFRAVEGTEMTPPGEVDVRLDPGEYRIYVKNHLANAGTCSSTDEFPFVQSMKLTLVPKDGGRPLTPERTGHCDGGSDENGMSPVSVSQFVVSEAGDYILAGEAQPGGITAYNRDVTVHLTASGHRVSGFAGGLGGTLVGIFLIAFGLRRRRTAR